MDRSDAFAPSSDSFVHLIGHIIPTQALHGGDSETAADQRGQASISTQRLLKSVLGGKAGILQENRKPPRV